MEVVHVYSKRRSEFGRQCLLSDRPAELLVDIPPDPSLARHFVQRSPRDRALQACGDMSEHEVGVVICISILLYFRCTDILISNQS